MKTLCVSIALLWQFSLVLAQATLVSGPMLGSVNIRDAKIWFQFDGPGDQELIYWPESEPALRKSLVLYPNSEYGWTATAALSDLQAGTTYQYNLKSFPSSKWSFGTQSLWQWRSDPPAFRMAMGSCTYINEPDFDRPGKPYGGEYEIYTSISNTKPELMLWLGDNVYFREVDWTSKSGMVHRYSHTRRNPELNALLPACAHYAIWDDHDFGPNDATGCFVHKESALEVFEQFWANPTTGISHGDGITTQFNWNDIDYFLLDNRYNRTSSDLKGLPTTILGEDQIQWLIQSLKASAAPFKMVAIGGQVLSTAEKFENYSTFPEERTRLLKLIEENDIRGVIFLTGDRHCTELSKLELAGGNVIYDLTCSPLSSTAYDVSKEENTLRVPGTLVPVRNFATIEFSGPSKERIAEIKVFNSSGEMLWIQRIESITK